MNGITSRARLAVAVIAWLLTTMPLGAAVAQAHVDVLSTSRSWAGYIVTRRPADGAFKGVAGSWVQPDASCIAGRPSSSLFWVGLGGYKRNSFKIEQIGTEAVCSGAGRASYAAWYELAPKPPVRIKLAIAPGDAVSAGVTVTGHEVFFHLRNRTSGHEFVKRQSLPSPDTSSAEWITEAPLECYGRTCIPEPLTDFGTITFSGATAVAADGHVGGLASPSWTTVESKIVGSNEGVTPSGNPLSVDATPALSSSGASFSVTWLVISGPAP